MAKRDPSKHYNDIDPSDYGGMVGSKKVRTSLLWDKGWRRLFNDGWGEAREPREGGRRPRRKPDAQK